MSTGHGQAHRFHVDVDVDVDVDGLKTLPLLDRPLDPGQHARVLELFRTVTQETVYLVVAGTSTVLFGLKLLASLFLGGHDDGGSADTGDTGHHLDSGASFTLLTTQSILAFMMGIGWMGLAARSEFGFGSFLALLIGSGFGAVMMVLAAALAYSTKRLNQEKTFDLKLAVGARGKVYLTIPERGTGTGQVQIAVQGRLRTLPAHSVDSPIASFTPVVVVSVQNDGSLLVKPST